jgi:hypothetical protein
MSQLCAHCCRDFETDDVQDRFCSEDCKRLYYEKGMDKDEEPDPVNWKAVKTMTRTCCACPSQWEGRLEDGRMVYVRYRWGYLSVCVSPKPTTDVMDAVGGEEVFGTEHGEGLDGGMDNDEMLKLTGITVAEWKLER